MNPKRLLALSFLVFALSAGPVLAEDAAPGSVAVVPAVAGTDHEPAAAAAPQKLVFHYPCRIVYAAGAEYPDRVLDRVCDYIHASVKGGADYFNALPTLEAQKAFLRSVGGSAEDADGERIVKLGEAIKAADPSKIPKTLAPAARIAALEKMMGKLNTDVLAAGKPFLWPVAAESNYIDPAPGSWPSGWKLYLGPAYSRFDEIYELIQAEQTKIIDRKSAEVEKKLKRQPLKKTADELTAAPAAAGAALNKLFDGGGAAIPAALAAPVAAGALVAPPPPPGGVDVPGAVPVPVSDLQAAPPPIPKDEGARGQRNYFARGTKEGAQRLKDDARITVWHAFGQSTTVGDPYGKAPLIIHQKGPSCAVAAQYEAMKARGRDVKIADLALEGRNSGVYVDYPTATGGRAGGTNDSNLDALLKEHKVSSTLVQDATPQQLDAAIRSSGDAIVAVRTKVFWNDPSLGENEGHAVYVTGEEVDPHGKVLGYYFNDTGTGEAARFVSADVFLKSWKKKLVILDKKGE